MPGGLEYTVKVAGCLRNSPYSPARFSLERMDRMTEKIVKGSGKTVPMQITWSAYFRSCMSTLMRDEDEMERPQDRWDAYNDMMSLAVRLEKLHGPLVCGDSKKKENDDATV